MNSGQHDFVELSILYLSILKVCLDSLYMKSKVLHKILYLIKVIKIIN
jgi:hypothetical protein